MLVGDTAAIRFVKKTLSPCYEISVPSSELAALAQRAQSGDAAARHELLVELYRAVRKHVYLVIGAGPIAEDAVQETMIALDRGLAAFRGDASRASAGARSAWNDGVHGNKEDDEAIPAGGATCMAGRFATRSSTLG